MAGNDATTNTNDHSSIRHSSFKLELLAPHGTVDLIRLPRGRWRKALVGLAVKRTTTVPLEWIVNRLQMGARSTVSREFAAMARRLEDDAVLRSNYAAINGGDPLNYWNDAQCID